MKNKLSKKNIFISLIIGCLLLFAGCGGNSTSTAEDSKSSLDKIKDKDKLIVGVKHDMPLFGLKNSSSGEVEGFDVDLAKGITEKILGDEDKVEFMEANSKTRLELLNNEDIDLLIAYTQVTEEREEKVDFSQPYFEAGQTLLVPVDSPIEEVDDIDAPDQTISVAKGATAGEEVNKLGWDTKLDYYENWSEAFTALRNGKAEALMNHNAQQMGYIEQTTENGEPQFRIVGPPVTDDKIAMAVKKDNSELLEVVNDYLDEIKDDGTYDEMYDEWFGDVNQE